MSQPDQASSLPAPQESEVSNEIPFSVTWIRAVDPRVFTPVTWEHGRATTIYLSAPDNSVQVHVERRVTHDLDSKIRLVDEVFSPKDGADAGAQEVSQFRYEFDDQGNLTDYDPTPDLSPHTQDMVTQMSGLVGKPGSTIYASNDKLGPEASFVSDGTQWLEVRTGTVVTMPPAIALGRLAIEQPVTE